MEERRIANHRNMPFCVPGNRRAVSHPDAGAHAPGRYQLTFNGGDTASV